MIEVRGIGLSYPGFALRDLSFAVPTGQYCVIMGRTGCGKTTLIEILCGLRRPETGRILLSGRDITRERPGGRQIGYVPQDKALFEEMTVRENLGFGLALRKWPKEAAARKVESLALLLGIGSLLERRAQGLSGGEAQRVALGRALAIEPEVLCLDEPLSALDRDTHESVCALLADLHRRTGVTVLHITHNREEARLLGERVLLFEEGRLREETEARPGNPQEGKQP